MPPELRDVALESELDHMIRRGMGVKPGGRAMPPRLRVLHRGGEAVGEARRDETRRFLDAVNGALAYFDDSEEIDSQNAVDLADLLGSGLRWLPPDERKRAVDELGWFEESEDVETDNAVAIADLLRQASINALAGRDFD